MTGGARVIKNQEDWMRGTQHTPRVKWPLSFMLKATDKTTQSGKKKKTIKIKDNYGVKTQQRKRISKARMIL